MAAKLHPPSVYALLDVIGTPVLIFGSSGLVTYANPAAKRHPGRLVDVMSGHRVIKSLVASATLGKLSLPYSAQVQVADGHQIQGQFMPGFAGLDMAFLITPEAEGAAPIGLQPASMQLKDVIGLLRDELMPPVHLLLRQVQQAPMSSLRKPLELACKAVIQRLSRLVDLTEVFGNDALRMDDRIELPALVQQLCAESSDRAATMGVQFQLVTPQEVLPPVYGNHGLLSTALLECLENALVHSWKEPGSELPKTIQIRLAHLGAYVVITVCNQGPSRIKVSGKEQLHLFSSPAPGETHHAPRLGLPLVQQIVRLHGGNMRLTSDAAGEKTQLLIELPTGAPVRGQQDVNISQAERYAKDLAMLMSRRKKEQA